MNSRIKGINSRIKGMLSSFHCSNWRCFLARFPVSFSYKTRLTRMVLICPTKGVAHTLKCQLLNEHRWSSALMQHLHEIDMNAIIALIKASKSNKGIHQWALHL